MKIDELKKELKERGLPVSGKKSDLVHRLEEAEEGETKSNKKQKTEEKSEELPEKQQEESKKEASTGKTSWLDNLTDPGWKKALTPEFEKIYFQNILSFLDSEKSAKKQIFPPEEEIFSAFNYTPLDKVKVVILGQDPYHDDDQAHGLCFSVKKGIKPPPSLKNIYKELVTDIPGFKAPSHGFLEKWAKEGVLLLNASLTVQAHKANSHSNCGWLTFTDSVIKVLNENTKGVVFILWGGFAQKKGKIIDTKKHQVIAAAHPSPLSVTKFLGCKVFSKTNAILKENGQKPIDWTLPQTI